MPNAVVEDWDGFVAFLADQPFCIWAGQKREEIIRGAYSSRGRTSIHPPPPKNDNAELAAALSSMA